MCITIILITIVSLLLLINILVLMLMVFMIHVLSNNIYHCTIEYILIQCELLHLHILQWAQHHITFYQPLFTYVVDLILETPLAVYFYFESRDELLFFLLIMKLNHFNSPHYTGIHIVFHVHCANLDYRLKLQLTNILSINQSIYQYHLSG